ncbi:MAG: hypothetical protein ABFS35_07190 [Bacteroidota bacterium]
MQTVVNNKYIPVLESLNYNVNEAVSEFLLLKIHNKVSEYKNELLYYSEKYKKSFTKFEEYINSIENSENIDEYNDYLAWKFSFDSLDYYENQLKTIK